MGQLEKATVTLASADHHILFKETILFGEGLLQFPPYGIYPDTEICHIAMNQQGESMIWHFALRTCLLYTSRCV